MADTIQLYLMENRSIKAEFNNRPYAYEGGINIVAGEINATQFEIKSVPARLKDATITLEMYNALNVQVQEPEIKDNIFMLPAGMAVAGYGQFIITLTLNKEKVVFLPFKIKVANTRLDWQQYTIATVPLEIGITKTIAAGKQAKVENVGSKDFPILNFYIPQGEKGDMPIIDNSLAKKNLYNLGRYDTYTDDSEDTIIRKTLHITKADLKDYGLSGDEPYPNFFIRSDKLLWSTGAVVNNYGLTSYGFEGDSISFTYKTPITRAELDTVIDSFIIQAEIKQEYTYTESIINNQPIRPANQKENSHWHKEWEKCLNLSALKSIPIGESTLIVERLPVGTYTCTLNPTRIGAQYELLTLVNGTQKSYGVRNVNEPLTFTVQEARELYLYINGDVGDMSIMLNRGPHPYPYNPYNGEIIHENRVPLYMTTDSTSPAQTIGGNWESLDSFRSGNNTIYVWRKI